MYFITTKRMLEVCFSAHPNIQYRTCYLRLWIVVSCHLVWRFNGGLEDASGAHQVRCGGVMCLSLQSPAQVVAGD